MIGRIVCETILYKGFKERIRITKELQRAKRHFEVYKGFIIAY